jgi:hypothetical protein
LFCDSDDEDFGIEEELGGLKKEKSACFGVDE